MPLHRIFVPTGLYTPADKAAMAQAITDVYTAIPPFYVVVLFIDLEPSNFFVGGKTTERMVRISVEHLARNFAEYEFLADVSNVRLTRVSQRYLETPLHGPVRDGARAVHQGSGCRLGSTNHGL